MDERQLDRVPDLLDLRAEPADVGVVDHGDLLEEELVDLGLGDDLERHGGLGVHQHRVAGPDGRGTGGRPPAAQPRREVDDVLLVIAHHHPGPLAVGQDVPEHRGDAGDRQLGGGLDDGHRLVETDRDTGREVGGVDPGREGEPHPPTGGHDLRGVRVGRVLQHDAVGAGRRTEALDLTLEGPELVAGVLEELGEADVACAQGVDLDRLLAVRTGPLVHGLPQPRELRPVQRDPVLVPPGRGTSLGHRDHLPSDSPTIHLVVVDSTLSPGWITGVGGG